MSLLSYSDIQKVKKELQEDEELGLEQRATDTIIFKTTPSNPQEILGTIDIDQFNDIFREVYDVE